MSETNWIQYIENEDRKEENANRKYRYHNVSFEAMGEDFLYRLALSFGNDEIKEGVITNPELEAAVQNLTSKQQRVILLFLKGYNQKEIAKILKCSISAVSKLFNRAITSLETQLNC